MKGNRTILTGFWPQNRQGPALAQQSAHRTFSTPVLNTHGLGAQALIQNQIWERKKKNSWSIFPSLVRIITPWEDRQASQRRCSLSWFLKNWEFDRQRDRKDRPRRENEAYSWNGTKLWAPGTGGGGEDLPYFRRLVGATVSRLDFIPQTMWLSHQGGEWQVQI